jgi:hypothetical protein
MPVTFLPKLDNVAHKLTTCHSQAGLELHFGKKNLSQKVSQQQQYLNTGVKFNNNFTDSTFHPCSSHPGSVTPMNTQFPFGLQQKAGQEIIRVS